MKGIWYSEKSETKTISMLQSGYMNALTMLRKAGLTTTGWVRGIYPVRKSLRGIGRT